VFTKNQTNPYFQYVRLGADSAALQMNAKVQHYIPTKPDSIPEQLSQVEDVIVKRPDAVVFIPVDNKAMVPSVAKLNAASIPVINVTDRLEGVQLVSFVGADDYNLGLETGRYLLKAMGGKGSVVIIEGVKAALSSTTRVRGFRKALDEFPQVKVLASQPGNNQRLQALQVMENLLQSYPQIDGVFGTNDAMATGVIEALEGANRKALVVGINGTKEAIDAVKAGKLLATGDYGAFLQGCFGTMSAIRHLRKLPVEPSVVFAASLITKTNVETFDVPMEKLSCPRWESLNLSR
jgi:ribose transport system substrate-binding protein